MNSTDIPTPEFIAGVKERPYLKEYLSSKATFRTLMWHRGSQKTTALINDDLIAIHKEVGLYWLIGPYLTQIIATAWKDPNTSIFRWIPPEYRHHLKVNESDHSITFPNGSIYQLKGADNANSLRGPKPKKVSVDEYGEIAKRWGSEFREAILEPSIRSSKGRISYAGTPKGNNDFSHLLAKGKEGGEFWSSIQTVDDTGIYTKEEVENIRANVTHEDFFYQEYYCRILEGASSVFKGHYDCVEGELEEAKPGHRYVFGIDLARTFDRTVIVGFDTHTNHLVYFKMLHNETWNSQKEYITDALRRYNDAEAIVDATGGSDSFVNELMNNGLAATPFKISGNAIKRELVERLAMFLSNRYLTFPNIQEILDELNSFEYELTKSNNVTYNAPSGKHDDIVMAIALAVHRLQAFPQVFKPRTVMDDFRENLRIDPRTGYPL